MPKYKSLLVLFLVVVCGCSSNNNGSKLQYLPISNAGVRFDMQMDLPRVFVIGENERKILQMGNPPREALLFSLSKEDKWKVAHVLLTMRYEHKTTNYMDKWNGMNFWVSSEDVVEMNRIKSYWYGKMERGELVEANPVFSKQSLERISGTEEASESRHTKIEEFFEENPVNMDILSEDLFGEKPPMTNPPPRGAEGGSGSEEINP